MPFTKAVQPIGILFAITSAVVWGSGDFSGGLATRRANQFQVLALAALSGIMMLVALSLLFREAMPTPSGLAWSALAGLAGAMGIASLYQGLSIGSAATVAPTAAVLTAALPIAFNVLTAGLPGKSQLAGFGLAITGIWLVSHTPSTDNARGKGLKLALVAGCGFGGFLILIAQVDRTLVFAPLAVARAAMFAVAIFLTLSRGMPLPSLASSPMAYLAGVLDAGGNVFYLLARQHTRLDVAAVLSSLYPVATVVLARVVSKDPVTSAQWTGVVVCVAAVALIAT